MSVVGVNSMNESENNDAGHGQNEAILSDGSKIPFGALVWSAGLSPTKFVSNCDVFEKGPTGRIMIDRFLRTSIRPAALGQTQFASQGLGLGGRIYALGDCAANVEAPLTPLASVAEQQADYLANVLNDFGPKIARGVYSCDDDLPIPEPVSVSSFPPFPSAFYRKSRSFRYIARGAMSSIGGYQALIDLSHVDTPIGRAPSGISIHGVFGFLVWNGYYFSKQYSLANMILNPLTKLKSYIFGRDISRF